MVNSHHVVVRPLNPQTDLEDTLEFLNAAALAEGHAQAITADQLRSALAAPNFYRWLAFDRNEQDRPVGIGVVFHQMAARCYGDAKVHPEWRRRGIGRGFFFWRAGAVNDR